MRRPWPENKTEYLGQCPVCGSSSRKLFCKDIFDRINSAPGVWTLYRCCSCKSAYLDPRPTHDSIGIAYETYYTHISSTIAQTAHAGFARQLRNGYLNKRYGADLLPSSKLGELIVPLVPFLAARANRLFRHLPPIPVKNLRVQPGILEVGCGSGDFLVQMNKLGWRTLGIEPDIHAVEASQSQGIEALHGSLEDFDLPASSFDAITLHHVIEHLHDPIETLRRCRLLLKGNGTISIVTPNIDSVCRRIFHSDWYALQPPCHLTLFTPSSLADALRKAGFHAVKVHASTFAYSAMFNASKNNKPSLRRSYPFIESIASASAFGFMSSLIPNLNEEVVITASA